MTAAQIYKELAPFIDTGEDYLFVTQVGKNYFGILPSEAWEWLRQRDWQQQPLLTT